MISHPEDDAQFWEDIYLEDDAGWDLGGPTPVFESVVDSLTPGKMCIMGCGKGHDAIMFAQKGFDVTAVDFAPSAIRNVKDLAVQSNLNITSIQTDLFSLSPEINGLYDYVIEQTCFCAINPNRRAEYENVVYRLLKPGGQLIGLWFPLDKSLDEGGPPWGTTIEEVKSLFSNRWVIDIEKYSEQTISPRLGREKLMVLKKFVSGI